MNLINILSENADKNASKPRVEKVSVLIGKAWPKADAGFTVSPLSEPVPGKSGEYQISGVYPLIVTDYCTVGFGVNKKCDTAKNQNTHWVFLNVEKARLEEYTKLLSLIGQELDTSEKKA